MKSQTLNRYFILLLATLTLLTACGADNDSTSQSSTSSEEASPYDLLTADENNGIYLFNYHCSGCHGIDALGSIGPDITAKKEADIRLALSTVPNMKYLPDFSDQELVDIVSHLEQLELLKPKEIAASQAFKNNSIKQLASQHDFSSVLAIQVPYEYAEIFIYDHEDNLVANYHHFPERPLSAIKLTDSEFPITVAVRDSITDEEVRKILYTPQDISFKK